MNMIFPNKEFRIVNPDFRGFGNPRRSSENSKKDSSMGSSIPLICHNPLDTQSDSDVPSGASQEKRVRKGNPMTPYTKRIVKSAAYLLEKAVGKENLAFLTLTLPGESEISSEELKTCNINFSELMRQFCQVLSRRLDKLGLSEEYVCVTEIQPKRFLQKGQVALHAHLVFQSRKNRYSNWAITKEEIRNVWEKLLTRLLKRNINAPAATRIESVKKSISKYLGKYLSKGGDVLKKVVESGKVDELPPKWDRIANSLRTRVKLLIKVPSDYAKRLIANNLESLKRKGVLLWYYVIEHDFGEYDWFNEKKYGDRLKIVGYCGEFTTEKYMNEFAAIKNEDQPEYEYEYVLA
jgi:hypothetical protein